jgi:isopenicillin N synthase-like dioxygenase
LVDHGITIEEIEAQFAISKSFFDLPLEVKGKTPHDKSTNNGWEYKVGPKKTENKTQFSKKFSTGSA